MKAQKTKRSAGPLSALPEITYRCPLTHQALFSASPRGPKAKALGFEDSAADGLLVSDDGRVGYPVKSGIPHLAIEYALGADLPPSPVEQERHDEINEEIEIYDRMASRDQAAIENASIRLLGRPLSTAIQQRTPLEAFPEPLDVWVDSVGSADTQYVAYRHLAPLDGARFLQLGGSGSHAIKALLAGAECAGLLSNMAQTTLLYLSVIDRQHFKLL